MISITLNCASVDQLHQVLRDMLKGEPSTRPIPCETKVKVDGPQETTTTKFYRNAEAEMNAKLSPELVPQENAAETAQPEKKTRTRKPKETKPQEVNEATAIEPFETQEQVGTSEPLEDKSDKEPTKEQVHQALQQVNVAVNLTKAREILSQFGVQRVSEVKPSDFRAFIKACNEAVAMS